MKAPPAAVDPRSVSAYSVYNGLKARKRNRKSGGAGDAPKNEVSGEVQATSSKAEAKKETRNGQSGLPKSQVKLGNVLKAVAETSDSSEVKKGKKKRKKKNKSKKNKTVSESELECTTPSEISAYVSEDDEEEAPPSKSKKFKDSDLVPNPFASKATINGNSKSPKKKNAGTGKTPSKQSQSLPSTSSQSLPIQVAKKKSQPELPPGKVIEKNPRKRKQDGQHSTVSDVSYMVESKVPPPDPKETFTSKRVEDSVEQGKSVLEWLIHPVTSDEFMKKYWEKKPLLIKRLHKYSKDFYKFILTTQSLDDILRRHVLKYGVNLDITSYTDGVRETLSENMQGRVRPAVVWDYYNNGCSLRMLNPQTYAQKLWRINSALQEWFGSFVGANMYLTPPDSQGFAPHYDDIEAFILQIEGKKQWKVYAPRDQNEKLPRFSSKNFSEEGLGEPIIDVILEEGDLLYFPRGYIHQAKTVEGEHSLHLTISCHQLNTYGDLLKHHVNHALEKLMASNVEFRQGLPADYLSYMGIAHENSKDKAIMKKREAFSKKVERLVGKLAKEPADFAADAMGKKFIWDSLPPHLSSTERETNVLEDGEFMVNGKVFNRVEFGPEVEVKLVRKNCVRMVVEEGLLKLYYASENSLVYHEENAQYLELSVEVAPAVNHLINQYPDYTKIEDLPLSSDDIAQKIQIISDLWERGLIFTNKPLESCDIDEEGFDIDEADSSGDDENEQDDVSEVESINLSDLPEEGEDDSDSSEFYDTSMMMDSDDLSEDLNSSEISEDADDGQADIDDYFNQLGGVGENSDSDEDDLEEEEEVEDEEEIDSDEFDKLDQMEESDED